MRKMGAVGLPEHCRFNSQLLFSFLSLYKRLSTGYLPGIAAPLDLEMFALTGAAACQELRHFHAILPQTSSVGTISPPSLAGMRCQPVISLICLESSLVPALFASSHGNRQAAEKVFTPTLYLITALNQHLFAWRHNSLLLVGTYFLGIVVK